VYPNSGSYKEYALRTLKSLLCPELAGYEKALVSENVLMQSFTNYFSIFSYSDPGSV